MYSLVYSERALKQLKKLDKDIRKRIISGLERCRIRSYVHIRKLVGCPYFRLRVGDYRVIIELKNNQLRIFVIGVSHRKNAYKN